MLKGISPFLSPDLLKTLYEMGHGDEIAAGGRAFSRTFFGAARGARRWFNIPQLLDGILPLFALETLDDAVAMMQPDARDAMNTDVEADFPRRCAGMVRECASGTDGASGLL